MSPASSELLLLLAGLCLLFRALDTAGMVFSRKTLAGTREASGGLGVHMEDSGQGLEEGEVSGSNGSLEWFGRHGSCRRLGLRKPPEASSPCMLPSVLSQGQGP